MTDQFRSFDEFSKSLEVKFSSINQKLSQVMSSSSHNVEHVFFFFLWMGIQNGHNVPFLKSVSLQKRKIKALKRIKQIFKISEKGKNKEKKSCHLVLKVVIDLPFEGRKVERSQKYRRERVPTVGRNHHWTYWFLHWRVPHNSCGQMMPVVWNVAEPLEVEYRWPIHQSSDQSTGSRKEIEMPPCGEETEGQESRSRRDHQSSG